MLVLGPLSRGTEPAMVMIMNEEAHIDLAPRAAPAVADVSLLFCVRHIPNDRLDLAPGHLTHLQCAHRNHHASWSKAGACLPQKGRECMLGLSPLRVLSHPHSLVDAASHKNQSPLLVPVPQLSLQSRLSSTPLCPWFALGQRHSERKMRQSSVSAGRKTDGPRTLREGSALII